VFVAERPRILVLGAPDADWLRHFNVDADVVHAATWADGLDHLRRDRFDAVLANPTDTVLFRAVRESVLSEHILASLADGAALVDFDLRVRWSNPTFDAWCGGPAVGRGFHEALGTQNHDSEFDPFHTALAARGDGPDRPATVTARVACRDDRLLDLHITPVHEPGSRSPLLIALGRDVTTEVRQREKLDALHQAGRELAALSTEQLAEMGAAERVDYLKRNIAKFAHDLLHYDTIEVRLLDRQTGRLEPFLQEGMTPEAANRILLPRTEEYGVTGFVAATGKGYLCRDTGIDPLYLPGAPGARSSLTVPILYRDLVVGTFNVESPRLEAFAESDLKRAELFCRDIADALHTLDLLSAEKSGATTQSLEAVSREIALPVDDILTAATSLLERYIGLDPEMADKLRTILVSARTVKHAIQKVGEDLAPAPPTTGSAPKPPAQPLKGVRVLVADNEDRTRRSAHALLGRWGCIVETARDGREALTMARQNNYDVVLVDIRLPDMTGYDFYCAVREAQPQARVVLMTGYGYDPSHSIVNCRREGLQHILYKPFRVDQLLDALRDVKPTE
jgi:CheY-like chemotaxis protein